MKVASLCSGCGGLDIGFEQAGHEIVFAIDIDPIACETYEANDIGVIVNRDIRGISFLPVTDIIIGGPPCQQFSVASRRRKRRQHEESPLILEFARVILINEPAYFLMENVLGLLYAPHANLLQAFLGRMANAGYAVTIRKLDAADYGVPQHRKRVFFFGAHNGAKVPAPPTPTHSYGIFGETYISVNAALGWTETRVLSQNRSTWAMQEAGKGYFYSSDCPARTITTHGHSICKPPPWRLLTVREVATLQSFPDDFEFKGNVTQKRRQIGNAVPPLMARCIAEMFKGGKSD